MLRLSVLCAIAALAALAGGCGGDDERAHASSRDRTPPREPGILSESQVIDVNQAVANYNRAVISWEQDLPTCQAQARRLVRRHAPLPRVLRCHVEDTRRNVQSVAALRATLVGLDGGWSQRCGDQLTSMRAFLIRYHAAWAKVLGDWRLMATGRGSSVERDVKLAHRLAVTIGRSKLPAFQRACMTSADIADGLRLANLAVEDARGR
jgi:hypothetical protein